MIRFLSEQNQGLKDRLDTEEKGSMSNLNIFQREGGH